MGIVEGREVRGKWWTDHGFSWKLTKRVVSKSVYVVTKDNITISYEIPNEDKMDMKRFMEGPAGFTHYWDLHLEYRKLRNEAKKKGLI